MITINISTSTHEWEKKNLVTISKKGRGSYDEMVCKNCGMKAQRFNFEQLRISEVYNADNVRKCPKAKPVDVPKRIKVRKCSAVGKMFSNLIPGSEHDIVKPPKGYHNDSRGVWVMGVGEPVKLLRGEYEAIIL